MNGLKRASRNAERREKGHMELVKSLWRELRKKRAGSWFLSILIVEIGLLHYRGLLAPVSYSLQYSLQALSKSSSGVSIISFDSIDIISCPTRGFPRTLLKASKLKPIPQALLPCLHI